MIFLYSSDINYVDISKISIASLFEANSGEKIKIYYIDDRIGEDNKKWLTNLAERNNAEIIFIDAGIIDTSFITKDTYSAAGYYRILISDIIPEDKVIYIDCDTIILNSFHDLWKTDISDYLIAGVKDTVQSFVATSVGLENNSQYINAGILYLNLKKWREENVNAQVRNAFAAFNGKVPHHDQGVINYIAKGRMMYLPVKYNLMSQFLYFKRNELISLYKLKDFYTEEEIIEAKNNPVVVHLISKFYGRPWYLHSGHPYTPLFDEIANKYGIKLNKQDKPLDTHIQIRKKLYEHTPFCVYLLLERLLDFKRWLKFRKLYKA